ncbi:MAG: RrF2 family transcriptional regulator [Deltaproteobacteria bacterium]
MQVSKTLDYAVRSLTYMSGGAVGRFSMKQISETQRIPLDYLAKIMRKLVKGGLVRSAVGPDGGYTLRKSPEQIKLRDIYEAIEGDIKTIDCMDADTICALYESCPQIPVWDKMQVSMIKILENTTLQDMITQKGRTL